MTAALASPLPVAASAAVADVTEKGRQLFASSALGSSGRSCSTCHQDGKGLGMVGDLSDDELKQIINACIRKALQGKELAIDSDELAALLTYIRTFGK